MDFYAWNTGRAYPLLKGEDLVPTSAIVSAGFTVGPGSGYIDGEHTVHLAEVRLTGSEIQFIFRSDAPGLDAEQIVFTRDTSDDKYVAEFADATPDSSLSDSLGCPQADSFAGFLVTGPLDELVAALTLAGGVLTGSAPVEPALVQNLSQAFVRSINVANGDRTRYEPPEGCDGDDWPFPLQPLYVRRTCLHGPLRFQEGYNASLRQSTSDNAIVFDAAVGGGAGEPCDEVPVFDGEEDLITGLTLDGAPLCEEVFRSINGVYGRVLAVSGGQGVAVTFKPSISEIEVNVNAHDMAVCIVDDQIPAESLNCDSLSESLSEIIVIAEEVLDAEVVLELETELTGT